MIDHRHDWEELSELDPLWAILSNDEKRFGRWEMQEFLETGNQEISRVMVQARNLGLPREHRRALDFGCGVGRLTRAMRPYFQECIGVDISQSMITRAARLSPECSFIVNRESNLHIFPSDHFDFVYSNLVLQHQPSRQIIVSYIGEMLRVLSRQGLLVFQLPCFIPWRNRIQGRRRLWSLLRSLGAGSAFLYNRLQLSPIRMNSMERDDTVQTIQRFGARDVLVLLVQQPGDPFLSCVYYCTKYDA